LIAHNSCAQKQLARAYRIKPIVLPHLETVRARMGVLMTENADQNVVAELEEKLRSVAADYEGRFDQMAELVARVRHEINNPLTGVLGQAQLLLREELNEKTRKRVQTIEELAVRMRDTVAQLRQVQRSMKPGQETSSGEIEGLLED